MFELLFSNLIFDCLSLDRVSMHLNAYNGCSLIRIVGF